MAEIYRTRSGEQRTDPDDISEEDIETLYERLQQQERVVEEQQRLIDQLRDKVDDDPDRDRRGRGGTPNLEGEIRARLSQGAPRDDEMENVENATLHDAMANGPDAFTDEHNPIYPVHERAYKVLVHAPQLARSESEDGTALFLTVPTVKRFLESQEGDRLKHTQVRRVFETIEKAGDDYPRPPTLHKNRDGVVELAIYDYSALFDQSLLA